MFFETDRLVARRLFPSDAPAFCQISTQPHVLRWMPDWDIPAERAEALIGYFINGYTVNDPERHPFLLALWHKTDRRLVGICGFGPKEELGGRAEIAYFLDVSYLRQGLMAEAAGRAVSFFFARFERPFLYALADEQNLASVKILQGLGFVRQPADPSAGFSAPHYRLARP